MLKALNNLNISIKKTLSRETFSRSKSLWVKLSLMNEIFRSIFRKQRKGIFYAGTKFCEILRKLSNIFLLVRDSDERESSAVYTLYWENLEIFGGRIISVFLIKFLSNPFCINFTGYVENQLCTEFISLIANENWKKIILKSVLKCI